MKHITRIIAVLVGLLLIFSGAIKLNDPVGTAIKLEEYFEVFATDFGSFFHVFTPLALYLSIFLSSIEIILGVALIIRWRSKLVLILLLLMMVFFTFLTFYSAYFNKVTDCGCFGDAIKLTPWESFTKDIVLDVALIFLLIFRRYLTPLFTEKVGAIIVAVTAILCVATGVSAYQHLPYIDFRAYKVGNHIPSMMKTSADLKYKYVMEKDGKTQDFDTYPTDTTWKFKEMVLLNPEAQPKITDYNVWNDEGD
ncbi:MAG: DoxX family protein, partial [Pedobacter sp.]